MATAPQQISRFGRIYELYDPDAAGGGPPTWILASEGAGGGGNIIDGLSAVIDASVDDGIAQGQALAMTADGTVVPTNAQSYETAVCVGLAAQSGVAGDSIVYIVDGQLALRDWSAVTGSVTLIPGIRYFLNPDNLGHLQGYCPQESGVFVCAVGTALSETLLEIEITLPIKA